MKKAVKILTAALILAAVMNNSLRAQNKYFYTGKEPSFDGVIGRLTSVSGDAI